MNQNTDAKNSSAPKRRSCLGCLGRAAIGTVIFLVILMAAGALYQAAASASDAKKYPPPGELYDVGDYKMQLYCTGEGSPTVILEAGAGSPSLSWVWVQEKAAGFARVCSYDRPGFGWSSPASTPLSAEQVAAILHQLLVTANYQALISWLGTPMAGSTSDLISNNTHRKWGEADHRRGKHP